MSRKFKIIFLVVFLLSVLLRLGLTLVNRQANDDHMEVVSIILMTHRLPTMQDCGECVQPKLFHFTVAKIIEGLGLANAPHVTHVLVAQLINFLAGVIILIIIWLLIKDLPFKSEKLKLLAFSLAALNPALIGINAQATNDTFAILFSTLALYFTYVFLQRQKIKTFLSILFFTLLGISTKTHVWVTAIAILMVFFIQVWIRKEQRIRTVIFSVMFFLTVPVLTFLNPLSQYIANYQEYGTPASINVPMPPFPNWINYTPGCDLGQPYCRPGILSIQSGFFTFMFDKLLKYPRVTHEIENYPQFRISFWSMLYGGAHSVHFFNYPPTWSTTGTQGFMLIRGILLLALIPTSLLILGVAMETFYVLKSIFKRDLPTAQMTGYGLFVISFIGYVLFVALYTMLYRDFAFMKAIFVFPALLVFPVLFLRAGEPLYGFLSKHIRWSTSLLDAGIVALLILYVVDIGTLIAQIYLQRYPF
jgi:hypothetical protein